MAETIERAQELLLFISANCDRGRWLNVGMALHDEFGQDGWPLFDAWSAESDQYNTRGTRAVWKSFKPGGGRTFATLVQYAKEGGYDPKKAKHRKQQRTPEMAAEQKAKADARRAQHEKEEAEEAAAGATLARDIYARATPITAREQSPYIFGKGIDSFLARLGDWPIFSEDGEIVRWLHGQTIYPIVNAELDITSLQRIDADGRKVCLRGGRIAGCFIYFAAVQYDRKGSIFLAPSGLPRPSVNEKPGSTPRIYVAEGAATAASIHMATGVLSLAAISEGNVSNVCKALVKKYRGREVEIVIGADNDLSKAKNTGLASALKAAREFGLRVAVPVLRDAAGTKCDFNDLYLAEGVEGVRKAFREAMVPATVPEAAAEPKTAAATRDEVPTLDEYPCFRVFDEWVLGPDGECYQPGVHYFGIKKGRGKDAEPEPYSFHVCGPLRLLAQTQAAGGVSNYGRQLAWTTTTGINQTWAMPARMLNADGKEIRARLLEGGLYINPEAQRDLHKYISQSPSMLKLPEVMCVQGTGWNSNLTAFALYTRTLGPQAAKVIFQSEFIEQDPYAMRGSLPGWRQGVAMPAFKNSAMTLAICLGFAGPMLALLQAESGGVHLWGESSKGKTTLLHAATSIWGHPEEFMKSWNTTVNGVEGAAAVRTHTLMTLDEIHQANPEEVGKIAYMLGNGEGKQRANVGGEARAVRRFLVSVLSSGEKSAEAAIGSTGNNITAGQAVRLVDINVTDRTYGVFDELHDHAGGGGLSEAVKAAAKAHHGHAGPALVEHLCKAEVKSALQDRYTALKMRFKVKAQGPQEERVAARMALYALAGELATEAGLTGWPAGWATEAVEAEYLRWWASLAVRGHGDREPRQIVQALYDFLQAYGEARFESAAGAPTERVVPNRAGWKKFDGQKWLYLFTSKALAEATAGYASSQVLKTLDDNGVLITQPSRKAGGRRSSSERIGSSKRKEVVYAIDIARLSSLIDGAITGL